MSDGADITSLLFSEPEVTQMVSGNTVEYDLKGLQPATEYTLSVHAQKDTQRSETLSTHFTTGASATPQLPSLLLPPALCSSGAFFTGNLNFNNLHQPFSGGSLIRGGFLSAVLQILTQSWSRSSFMGIVFAAEGA